MKNFRVVLEIQVDANTPLDAAKKLQDWLHESDSNWQYYVQEDNDGTIHSIDLNETDEDAVLNANNYQPMIKN